MRTRRAFQFTLSPHQANLRRFFTDIVGSPPTRDQIHFLETGQWLGYGRAAGRSTAAQVAAIREAVVGERALVLSTTYEMASYNFRRTLGLLGRLEIRVVPTHSRLEIRFGTSGMIKFGSEYQVQEGSLRGYNFNKVIDDRV